MAKKRDPDPGSIISEFLRKHPEAISVLVRNRMACPGCPMSPFETLDDAVRAYELDPSRFLGELRQAIHCASGERGKNATRKTPLPRRS